MPVRFQKPLDVARPDEALAPRPAEVRAPEVTAARTDFQPRKRADGFSEGGAVPPAGALEAHVPPHGKVSLGILDPAWGAAFAGWAKPHRSDRLLELGFSSSAAHAFVDLGAQVVRLHAEPPNTPADVHALFAARLDPNQPLSSQGARAGTFDVATVNAGTSRVTPKEVAAALAPGGRLGVRGEAHLDAWQAALGELGFRAERHTTGGGEAWLSGQKPGELLRLPARVDRGSSVDRTRVAELAASAPFRGPIGKATVDDAQAAPGLAAFRAAFEAQAARGAIDLTRLPFTASVPRSATAGAPGSDALVVLAHPDDESLYTGATLAQLGLEGRDVRLAVATDGGGGRGQSVQLDAARKTELQAAARILGLSQVHPLGFPDTGKYADAQRTTPFNANDALKAWGAVPLVESLVREIRTQRPRQVLGFDSTRDPNYSLHGHHLALGAATAIAVELAADPNAFPEQLAAGLRPWAVEAQWATVPAEVAGAASVEGAPGLKVAALDAHASQRFSLSLPTERLRDGEAEALQEH